jgi:hypothetical protein
MLPISLRTTGTEASVPISDHHPKVECRIVGQWGRRTDFKELRLPRQLT